MKKQALLFCVFVCFSAKSFSQNCNCESNFEWVKKTFEENDVGFKYILEKKGEGAYKLHNAEFLSQIKNIKSDAECTQTLYRWLKFFRKEHIEIERNNFDYTSNSNNNDVDTPSKTREVKKEYVKIDLQKFENSAKNFHSNTIEGIYKTETGEIGIKEFDDTYKGFIIKTSDEDWKPKEIKFIINKDKKGGNFYLDDHSKVDLKPIEIIGKNRLKVQNLLLTRLLPKFDEEKAIDFYYKYSNVAQPVLDILNAKTIYFRIPSFDIGNKTTIENIIKSNKNLIEKTENLIIDLRYNGGGSDSSYKELLPLLYTNPIRTVGVQFLSTELNNKYFHDIIENADKYGISIESKVEYQKFYDKLQQNLGKFVSVNDEEVEIKTFSEVLPFPKNVGIIVNERNASSTEQFLLSAKQSKKVKIFGVPTLGALDMSNVNFVESPCKDFNLGYTISRSFRLPDFQIDDIGIQPDFYLDDEIPEYDWIEYVNNILNSK